MKWQYESENDDRDRVRDKLTLRYAEWLSKGKTSPHNNQDYTTRLQQRGVSVMHRHGRQNSLWGEQDHTTKRFFLFHSFQGRKTGAPFFFCRLNGKAFKATVLCIQI